MRISNCWPMIALFALLTGCEPYVDSDGTGTTVVAPPAVNERVDVQVRPGEGVHVDTDAPATPTDKPVDVDVTPGGGVDVDINPGAAVENIRERREERREERLEESTTP